MAQCFGNFDIFRFANWNANCSGSKTRYYDDYNSLLHRSRLLRVRNVEYCMLWRRIWCNDTPNVSWLFLIRSGEVSTNDYVLALDDDGHPFWDRVIVKSHLYDGDRTTDMIGEYYHAWGIYIITEHGLFVANGIVVSPYPKEMIQFKPHVEAFAKTCLSFFGWAPTVCDHAFHGFHVFYVSGFKAWFVALSNVWLSNWHHILYDLWQMVL